MKVSKWGNSLAIRLSNEMARCLQVSEGDEVEMRATVEMDGLVIRKRHPKQELREKVRALRGIMPKGFKFDRDEIHEG